MKRKIVQIAACGNDPEYQSLYGLADDGTVWGYYWGGDGSWKQMASLPDAPDPQPLPCQPELDTTSRVVEAAVKFVAGLKFEEDEHIAPELVAAVEEYEGSKE